MGIRIHKRIGYGLNDVEAEELSITDSRFNPNGYFMLDCEEQEEKYSIEGFIKYLEEAHEKEKDSLGYSMITFELMGIKESKKIRDIFDMVRWDGEFGLPNVVLFQNHSKDWSRFDDIIDYCECDSQENSVKLLKQGIYPYMGWMNSDTGETKFKVDDKTYEYLHVRQDINFGFNHYDLDKLLQMGFSSIEEADKKVVPVVPEFIMYLCKYLEVFKDDKTIYQLRPMLYTYWS